MVDSIAETEMPKPDAPKEEPNYDNISKGLDIMQTMRSYVDAIPTPGRDAGDALGDFSLFAVTKDVLSGALTLMEAPYKTTSVEDIFQATVDMGPGMASVGSRAPAGAIGMFGSRPGVWASKEIHNKYDDMLKMAEHMESVGDTKEKVWKQTGMARDHEGNWRYEISDGPDTKLKWDGIDKLVNRWSVVDDPEFGRIEVIDEAASSILKLDDVLDSPTVFEHWPELKDVQVRVIDREDYPYFADYNVHLNMISLNVAELDAAKTDPRAWLGTILHETQHALQYMQGRPSGTNTEWANEQMRLAIESVNKAATKAHLSGGLTDEQNSALRKVEKIRENWIELAKYHKDMAAYYADPGEVEARLTERSVLSKKDPLHPDNRGGLARGIVHPDMQFRPEDIGFPARPDTMNMPDGKKPFGTRPPSESRAPYDGSPEGSTNLPANQQRGTLTDDIMDDLSMYQMGQRADRDFYLNYINERMKPFALEMAEPDNANLTPKRRSERLAARAEEIQIRKGTIRALLGEGDDPSVWNAVRINQDVIRRLEEEMTALSGTGEKSKMTDPIDDILQSYAKKEKTAAQVQKELQKLGFKAHLRGKESVIDLEDLRTGEFTEYKF